MGKELERRCPLCGELVAFVPVHLRQGNCEARQRTIDELEERAREARREGRA